MLEVLRRTGLFLQSATLQSLIWMILRVLSKFLLNDPAGKTYFLSLLESRPCLRRRTDEFDGLHWSG